MFKYILCVVLCLLTVNANAALVGRNLDGDFTTAEAYFDTDLNITWLADANLAETETFGVVGLGPNGSMIWDKITEWLSAMNASNGGQGYLEVNTWRLASNAPLNGTSYDTVYSDNGSTDHGYNISLPGTLYEYSTASEMAHLYYITLGNIGAHDINGNSNLCVENFQTCLSNTGPFHNIEVQANYWTGSYNPPAEEMQWNFLIRNGEQYELAESHENYIWVVADGLIGTSVVPIPAAVWLFSSGLIGLIGLARRKSLVSK